MNNTTATAIIFAGAQWLILFAVLAAARWAAHLARRRAVPRENLQRARREPAAATAQRARAVRDQLKDGRRR